MKNSNTCPKCNSSYIAKIKSDSLGSRISTGTFSIAQTSYYVCCSCGYTESWIDNQDDLEKIKGKFLSQ